MAGGFSGSIIQVLVDLPKKEEVVYHCPLLPEQQDLYSAQLSRLCKDVEGESTLGIGVFMQLRKAANHPLLMRSIYDDDKLSQMAQLLAQVIVFIWLFLSECH